MRWLLLCSTVLLSACHADKIAQLEKQNKELAAKLETIPQVNLFDLQDRCAQQARLYLKSQGPWEKNVSVTFTNHYNQPLSKCFIEINATSATTGRIFISTWISDAFEGKDYGQYAGTVNLPVPPTICTVTSFSGEETECHSQEQFNALIKQYMEQ